MHSLSSPFSLFTSVFCSVILYWISLAIHRLYFSPVAHIPGPFLAKISFWYEFYQDVVCKGQYVFRLAELHKRYGPIIRVNPHEVHIIDPDFYSTIYSGYPKRRDKWPFFVNAFGEPYATSTTIGHDLHRIRRMALNPYFSKAKIRGFQPRIDIVINKFFQRMTDFRGSGEPMTISAAFSSVANDIVRQFAFGRSENRIEEPTFDEKFHNAFLAGARKSHFLKFFPWVLTLIQSLPHGWVMKLVPDMASWIKMQLDVREQVCAVKAAARRLSKTTIHEKDTILHHLILADLPPVEKSINRLQADSLLMVSAGTHTTSAAATWCLYHILNQPTILRTLKLELLAAWLDPSSIPSLTALEQLPYLGACIQEGLRLNCGVVSRLQRVSPNEALVYQDPQTLKQFIIPSGTPMSTSAYLVHTNPNIFPNPFAYQPERWLDNPRLDRYLVSFNRGTRQCIGMNLAYAELYLVLGTLFRRYGSKEVQFPDDEGYLQLYETTAKDVEIVEDGLLPNVFRESKGIRVTIHPKDTEAL